MNAVAKKHNNTKHSSIKLTPIQSSWKKNEKPAYTTLLDKRNKV